VFLRAVGFVLSVLSSDPCQTAVSGVADAYPYDGIPRPDIDPIELYAAGIDTSDYVARVAPLVRRALPDIGDLLDIGAGGGQLGNALRDPGRRWTTVEPSQNMCARLARFADAPKLIASGWETATVQDGDHDTVLGANIPAPLQQSEEFLARCRAWSRRNVVWVVPAQAGPRGLCLAGCLPATWHGEDETPGVDIVLRALPKALHPHSVECAEWTFSAVVPDIDWIATYLADRLGWAADDVRRAQLAAHLAMQAKPDPKGHRLNVFRKSAVLVWRG